MPVPRLASLAIYAIPLALLLVVIARGLWRTPNELFGMYANQDGMWAVWNVAGILEWGRFLDLSPFNPLSGMGSQFLPNLPWLNPAAAAIALPVPRAVAYLASYLLYAVEVFASIVVLFRVLGLSPLRSALGGLVHLLVLFPPLIFASHAMPWYALAPVNAHLMALANLALAAFIALGEGRHARNAVLCMAIVAALATGFFSAPVTFLTYVPVYGALAAAVLLWRRRERTALTWRLLVLVVIALAAWTLGVIDFLRGTVALSVRGDSLPRAFSAGARLLDPAYWMGAWREFGLCNPVEVPLCPKQKVFYVHLVAIGGALFQLWRGRGILRVMAGVFVALVAGLEFYAFAGHVSLFGSLHTIRPGFIMWSLYTLIPLFVVCLLFAPFDLRRGAGGGIARDPNRIVAWALVLAVPVCALALWKYVVAPNQPPPDIRNEFIRFLGRSLVREPATGPITEYLVRHASVRPGSPFRGYVVTYLGDPAGHVRKGVGYAGAGMAPDIYADARQYLNRHFGNRFQEMDLWELGIPTLEEYGQWITRPAFEFYREAFSAHGDKHNPNFLHVYRLDLGVLRALGARFVIADVELHDAGAVLRASQTAPVGTMFLYELDRPNLATFTPIYTQRVAKFKESVAAFKSLSGGGLEDTVIVFEDIPAALHRAEGIRMTMTRDGLRVAARSQGTSLVVLPVQFSRCLRIDGAAHGARLLRGNSLQTLLLFTGEVDAVVRFDFGLLGSRRCRLEDAQDLARLGL